MKNRLAAFVAILTMTFALAPVGWAARASQPGQIQGEVKEKCDQALPSDLRAQLVDPQGTAVPGMITVVDRDAKFAFSNVAAGLYTVKIIGKATAPDTPSTLGMTAVTVTAGRSSNAKVTVGDDLCGAWLTTTKLLIAAALVGGATLGVISTRDQASPSR